MSSCEPDDAPDLDDTEADALATLLTRTIIEDRYPLSQRIQVLKGILDKLRPPPAPPAIAAAQEFAMEFV